MTDSDLPDYGEFTFEGGSLDGQTFHAYGIVPEGWTVRATRERYVPDPPRRVFRLEES